MTKSDQTEGSLGQALLLLKPGEKLIRDSIFERCSYELEMKETAMNLVHVLLQNRTYVATIPMTGWFPERISSGAGFGLDPI